jgi:hypothetical protein
LGHDLEVVDHEIDVWHLFFDGVDFYLDVRTGLNGGFWLLIKINEEEREFYEAKGKAYLKSLAEDITRNPYPYFGHNAPIEMQKIVHATWQRWRQGPNRPCIINDRAWVAR